MKGYVLREFDVAPTLSDELPDPTPADDEVVVRVHSSSVNPVDAGIASGMLRGMFEYEFPVILGRDYAGTVESVGPAVSGYSEGDPVFGFVTHANPTVRDGSWAEHIAVQLGLLGRAPANTELSTLGATPLSAITAILALDALAVSSGSTVLIIGATGGVGSFATQLAAHLGATVIAPALPEDEDYLRGLGVSETVRREADVVQRVRDLYPEGLDALLDLVSYSPDALEAHAAVLRRGGRAASPNGAAGDTPGRTNLMAASTPDNLRRVAQLLESDAVNVPIQRSYPLAHAGDALQELSTEHTQGKLALTFV